MNDSGKNTNQPKAKLPENIDTPTSSQKDNPSDYLNVILSLNNIIPIVTIIIKYRIKYMCLNPTWIKIF